VCATCVLLELFHIKRARRVVVYCQRSREALFDCRDEFRELQSTQGLRRQRMMQCSHASSVLKCVDRLSGAVTPNTRSCSFWQGGILFWLFRGKATTSSLQTRHWLIRVCRPAPPLLRLLCTAAATTYTVITHPRHRRQTLATHVEGAYESSRRTTPLIRRF
jgi:hypothetical protein